MKKFNCIVLNLCLFSFLFAQTNEEIVKKAKQEIEESSTLIKKPISEGDTERAIEKLKNAIKSIESFEDAEAKKNQAAALKSLGIAYTNKNKYEEALNYFNQEIVLRRFLNDKSGEGDVFNNISVIYYKQSDYQKSLDSINSAISLYKEAKDKSLEMSALRKMGIIYSSLGDYQKAAEIYNQIIAYFKETNDKNGEALTLNSIGIIYYYQGKYEESLVFFDQAIETHKLTGNKIEEIKVIGNLGNVYKKLNNSQKSLNLYERALALNREIKDKEGEASVLGNIGIFYQEIGENYKALEYLKQSLEINRKLERRQNQAENLNSIGITYKDLGEFQSAFKSYNEALSISKSIGDKYLEAVTFNSFGIFYTDTAEYEKALEYFNQALKLFRSLKLKYLEAKVINSIGVVYGNIGNYQKQLDYAEQSLEINRINNDEISNIPAFINIASSYFELGDNVKSLEYNEKALVLAEKFSDDYGTYRALYNIGSIYSKSKELEKSKINYNKGLLIVKNSGAKNDEAVSLYAYFKLWRTISPQTAVLFGKISVNLRQELRSQIASVNEDSGRSFVKYHEPIYRQLAELLIEEKRYEEAQQVLSLFKEEEFYDTFQSRDKSLSSQPASKISLTQKETEIYGKYNRLTRKISPLSAKLKDLKLIAEQTPEQKQNVVQLEKELAVETEDFNRFMDEIPNEFGQDKNQLNSLAISDTAKFQENLKSLNRSAKSRVAALYTLMGEDNYYVIAVTPAKITAGSYPISRKKLSKKIETYRKALQNPASNPQPLAKELYDILVKPVAKEIDEAKTDTLMWSLDASLRYIPPATLFDRAREGYLVQHYRNVLFTKAPEQNLSEKKTVKNSWKGLGAGFAEESKVELQGKSITFPALPEVLPEIRGIVRKENEKSGIYLGNRLENGEFTFDEFRKNLQQKYQLVHIASHFYFDNKSPLESFLVLGNGERLNLSVIQRTPEFFKGIELLTLSACETAQGGFDSNGKEIEGLAVLAQRQGAKSILATLWNVNDDSTRKIMGEFYKQLSQSAISKAEALRQAQLKIMYGNYKSADRKKTRGNKLIIESQKNTFSKDSKAPYSHPYYWSSFILIGDWR
jgi:CHAT domain-containing protein/tetratricopeptide (TPR) repeat protein